MYNRSLSTITDHKIEYFTIITDYEKGQLNKIAQHEKEQYTIVTDHGKGYIVNNDN